MNSMTCQPQTIDGPKQNHGDSPTVISQWSDECSGTTKPLEACTNQAAGNELLDVVKALLAGTAFVSVEDCSDQDGRPWLAWVDGKGGLRARQVNKKDPDVDRVSGGVRSWDSR